MIAAELQNHISQQLELELAIHVNNQNNSDHSTYYPLCIEENMREIKGLATAVRENVAQLRAQAAAAAQNFTKEVENTNTNIGKLNSLTVEMKAANKEVEGILNDAGSNFPETPAPVDKNGVTLNKGK